MLYLLSNADFLREDLEKAQKIWSSKIYEKYGIYTSVNSALSVLYMIKYM